MQSRAVASTADPLGIVSILTRPEGRMQYTKSGESSVTAGFNPHPARRPDAIVGNGKINAAHLVSILTRPEGRMQSGRN